jgi:hypothetical protein
MQADSVNLPQTGALKVGAPATGAAKAQDDSFERDGSAILELMAAALKPSSQNREALSTWLDLLNTLPEDAPGLGVNTHSALIFLRRMGCCDGPAAKDLEAALATSWKRLTGSVPDDLNQRLPRKVLFKASRDEKDLHAAAFQTSKKSGDAGLDAAPLKDYTPEPQDAAYALSAVALALTEVGADMLTGGVAGLLIATVGESFLHDHGGHPRAKMKAWSAKPGNLNLRFRQAALGHLNAHHRTFNKHYGEMFSSPEAKAKLDDRLQAIKAKDPDLDIEIIEKEGYGITVSNEKMFGFAQPYIAAATVAAVAGVALGFGLTPVGVLSLYAFSVLPPFASKVLHPHLHKPRADALDEASPGMTRLLESRLVELMDKLHFGHHKGRGGNFNLVTPIGDALRQQLRLPTVKELLKMRESEKWPRAEFPKKS